MTDKDKIRAIAKIQFLENGCWMWTSATNGIYGKFWIGVPYYAHRVVFEMCNGYEPSLFLDHLCGNKLCVNPDHLEEVTYAVNNKRAYDRGERVSIKRTECKNGHEYSEHGYTDSRGKHVCRICQMERERRRIR